MAGGKPAFGERRPAALNRGHARFLLESHGDTLHPEPFSLGEGGGTIDRPLPQCGRGIEGEGASPSASSRQARLAQSLGAGAWRQDGSTLHPNPPPSVREEGGSGCGRGLSPSAPCRAGAVLPPNGEAAEGRQPSPSEGGGPAVRGRRASRRPNRARPGAAGR